MSRKRIARMLIVTTNPIDKSQYVTPAGGTLETLPLDGRWNYNSVWSKVTDAINARIKTGILKQNVGYAVYNYGDGRGMNLESVHVQAEFADLPRKFL